MNDDLLNKINADNMPESILGAVLVGIPTIWLLIKKTITLGKIADTQIASADTRIISENANGDVIGLLLKEVARMGARITQLEQEKDKLHEENLDLKSKLTDFEITIKKMQEEIHVLSRGSL